MKASIFHSILYLKTMEVSREQRATRGKKGKSSLSFCGTWFVTCCLYSAQQQQPWRSFKKKYIYIYFFLFMSPQVFVWLSSADSDTARKDKTKSIRTPVWHQSDIDIQRGTRVCSTGEPLDPEPRSDQPVIQRLQTLLHPAAEPTSDWGDSDPGLQSSTLWAQTFKWLFEIRKTSTKKTVFKKKTPSPFKSKIF